MLVSRLFTVCLVVGGGALSIKCGGRLPLQSWGADLYCGIGAPACPIGSYCHMDSDGIANFAVCCPNLLASAPLSSSFPLYTASFPLYSPLLPPASLSSVPLYSNPAPAVPLYTPAPALPLYTPAPAAPLFTPAPILTPTIPEPEICPETGKQKLSCPINSCLTSDCFGVPGASCMVDYCGNCGPKWYGPYNQVLTAEQCNWLPAWSARLEAFATVQNQAQSTSALNFGPLQPQSQSQFITQASQSPQAFSSPQFSTQGSMSPQPISAPRVSTQPVAPPQQVETIVPLPLSQTNVAGTRCPAPPDCGLDFLKASNSTNKQQMGSTPAEKQEKFWQEQAQQTTCHYENPQMAPNGCLMGCGTLVCEGPVRFLEIAMGQDSAVATWVPPLSAALGQTYTAELSYDGITWRNLPLEQPWATFARFEVEENKPFQLRVTAAGYPSIVKKFGYPENATMPVATVQIIEAASEEAGSMEASLEAPPLSLYDRQV